MTQSLLESLVMGRSTRPGGNGRLCRGRWVSALGSLKT
jgi:hypothetical protein